jgi:hypothetical protein
MSTRLDSRSSEPVLSGSEGELVSVDVAVDPRLLERALEALAHLGFPVNPQIYHQAAIGRVFPGGEERLEPVTIVEFPAFSRRLGEVQHALRKFGLPAQCVHVRRMLDEIHSGSYSETAAAGAAYHTVRLYKEAPAPH